MRLNAVGIVFGNAYQALSIVEGLLDDSADADYAN